MTITGAHTFYRVPRKRTLTLLCLLALLGGLARRAILLRSISHPVATVPRMGQVWAMALLPDNATLAVGSDFETVALVDTVHDRLIHRIRWPMEYPPGRSNDVIYWVLAVSPDGRWLLTGGFDTRVKVWSTRTGRLAAALPETAGTSAISFSRDGRLMVTLGYYLHLWDTSCWRPIPLPRGISRWSLSLSQDGEFLAAGCSDGTVRILRTGTWREQKRFSIPRPQGVALSPDARFLGVHSNGSVIVRECATGRVVLRPQIDSLLRSGEFSPEGVCLEFSPGGDLFAVRIMGTMQLWRTLSWRRIRLPESQMRDVVFSPDGRLAALIGADEKVRLWSVTGWHLQRAYPGREYQTVVFSPDSSRIAIARPGGTVQIWNTPE